MTLRRTSVGLALAMLLLGASCSGFCTLTGGSWSPDIAECSRRMSDAGARCTRGEDCNAQLCIADNESSKEGRCPEWSPIKYYGHTCFMVDREESFEYRYEPEALTGTEKWPRVDCYIVD